MIFDRHANLKYKYGNRHFWCRGYYVDTVGHNKEAITKYSLQSYAQSNVATECIRLSMHLLQCFKAGTSYAYLDGSLQSIAEAGELNLVYSTIKTTLSRKLFPMEK